MAQRSIRRLRSSDGRGVFDEDSGKVFTQKVVGLFAESGAEAVRSKQQTRRRDFPLPELLEKSWIKLIESSSGSRPRQRVGLLQVRHNGKAEGRRQKAEGKRQKAKGKRQKAKGKRQKAKGGRVAP
jgi:hypothetical protein